MASQKSFWKKYELIIVAFVTILFIYLLVLFNQKINFILGNELIAYLTPHQQSLSMHYGDVNAVNFDVSIDNSAQCKAACNYSFIDRSTNSIIDKGSFEIEKKQHLIKSYNLSVKRLGSGQDIYSFEVKCSSIRSFFCVTEGDEKSRNSLVIVDYDLTETEKELKKILKQNVTKLLELLRDADVLHRQVNEKYFELGFKVNLQNLSKQKIGIDDAYDKTRISIENLKSLWAIENYLKLNGLFNESFFFTLGDTKKSIEELNAGIDAIAKLHNILLSRLSALGKNLEELDMISNILENNETANSLDGNINRFNEVASSITNNTFEGYSYLIGEVEKIEFQQNSVIEKTRIPAAKHFFHSEYLLALEKGLLCSLKQDCEDNISAAKRVEAIEKFFKEYPMGNLRQNCESLKKLEQDYSAIRNETLTSVYERNASFPTDNEFLKIAASFRDNEAGKISNSYFESFEKIKSENKTNPEIILIADEFLPRSKTDIVQLNYSSSINLSLYLLSNIDYSAETRVFLSKCSKLKPTQKIGNFDFSLINASVTYKINSNIDAALSDNPPICCVFNDCKPCCRDDSCRNDPKTYPLIFLHGHSLARGNSPEFSLDAFNKLQSKLQEDGYLNAGIVSLYSKNEPVQKGIWGLSGKPVTVKASYYYDAFRKEDKYIVVPTKSENIDTYAIRLKDLIDMAKERANKPKVNIIAHSMGGLVARRYLQIFGDEDIDKFIMIATPNKGIAGAISDYCGFLGENRECQDMQENSLFINKLNDPSKQPKKAKLYIIIGRGCQMKLGDGDGVVLAENAKLENAKQYFINGTCGGLFGKNLHMEILDVEKHPETYGIVSEILKE
ncbi:alpha/beta fold hydrolase [Candidatus Woesearchaeota archaeon]|nr:alpha/beta fold hydrolase [Candidatus Woesearchaeota archaeon]